MNVLLLLGSNEDPEKHLAAARERLADRFAILGKSSVFESDPVGVPDTARFQNQAVLLDTVLSPQELKGVLRDIEEDLGRVRVDSRSSRVIDIDILLGFTDGVIDPTVPVSEDVLTHHHACIPAAELCSQVEIDGESLRVAVERLGPAPPSFVRIHGV